jgi:hypothetical protein
LVGTRIDLAVDSARPAVCRRRAEAGGVAQDVAHRDLALRRLVLRLAGSSTPAIHLELANSGAYISSGSSSWNLPRSYSFISATPVDGLVIEKICTMVSRAIGLLFSRSAEPNAPK